MVLVRVHVTNFLKHSVDLYQIEPIIAILVCIDEVNIHFVFKDFLSHLTNIVSVVTIHVPFSITAMQIRIMHSVLVAVFHVIAKVRVTGNGPVIGNGHI